VRTKTAETLSHTALSSAHAVVRNRPDVALVMNAANAPLLRILKAGRIPAAIHLDGLESRREKWRGMGARYYRWAEKLAVKRGDAVITDSQEIAALIFPESGRTIDFIPYGAPVLQPGSERLAEVNLLRRDYHLVVARFEPENHVLEIVHGYLRSDETRPLVLVGDAPYSRWYVDKVKEVAATDPRVHLLGSIYDQELLDQLYGNARSYIHGHSVGGTNPSLLRGMGAGAPVLAFDVEFNREVMAGSGLLWSDPEQLAVHLDEIAAGDMDDELATFVEQGRDRIADAYQWEGVTDQYEDLLYRLIRSGAQVTNR